jgi:tagatose-6-phosphate ketose/aldose isomerase
VNPLSRLLTLSESEKEERGLLYTPAEIAQQPATWQTTHRLFEEFREELASFLHHAHSERRIIYMIGAGTSDYIGHSIANLLRTCWECQISAVASKDLLTNRDDLIIADRNYLWVSFSRSGDSPEGVAVLKQALTPAPRIRHLVVSRNKNGLMVQLAQESRNCFAMLLEDEINGRGLAMTSSFTNMVAFGQHLAHLWDKQSFEATLDRMTEAADYILDEGAHLAHTLAQQGYRRVCFVGAGVLGEISRESALKLLELSSGGIQTMYETTLGLRHGPMSSLNQEALFMRFLPPIAGGGDTIPIC